MKFLKLFCCILIISTSTLALGSKTMGHLISLPLIEGAGAYTSIKFLNYDDTNLKAAGITNLSLLGINASLGAYTLWGGNKNYTLLRKIHRITGFVISAASIWAAISAATNSKIDKVDKWIAGGYSTLTVIPIIVFCF